MRGLVSKSCTREPSAWSQLLVYGGWGSYLVDVPSGDSSLLSFLPGYGALAWLSD